MGESTKNCFVFRLNDHGQGPELLREVFLERGWVEFEEEAQDDPDWNLWWRTSRFRKSDYDDLMPWQRVNHYPRSTAITKKDSLARNLKRMRGVYGPFVYNFSPVAFNLPNDYTKFVAEYSRMNEKAPNKDLCWICKPADLSRGRGIFIFRDLSELQYDCNAVVQQYLTNPLLISGYKFDLRIYVMVPSFHPLNIFIYQEGLVRFSTEKFNMANLGNMYSHLTNTSINKHSPSYTADKERVGPGCKWTLTQLRHYFRQANVDDQLLWMRIINIVILTLVLQANQVPKVGQCFELYGFDVIIDDTYKPWLLEVNFSPALGADCQIDNIVKKPMLHDLMDFLSFTEKDKLRGSDGSVGKVKHKGGNFRTSGERIGHHGARFTQRYRQGSYKKLPNISSTNLSTLSSSQPRISCVHGDSSDEEESDSNDIIPVMAGCGLPSVQHQARSSRMSGGSGSSRASSASSRKSTDTSDQHRTQKSEGRGSPALSLKHASLQRINSRGSQLGCHAASSPERVKGVVNLSRMEGKGYIQSDSGVSSYSGSSDTSDQSSVQEEFRNGERVKTKDKMGNKHELPTPTKKNEPPPSYEGRSVFKLKAQCDSLSLSNSSNQLNSRSIACIPNAGVSSLGVFPDSSPTKDSVTARLSLPRGTKSSVLRSSLHSDPLGQKRKLGQLGYTANPLSSKSTVILNRRGSLNNVIHSSRLSNYSKPWLRTNSSAPEQLPWSAANKQEAKRVGDFYLAYPFNEVTRKCSAGNQDVKVVVRECQKLLKEYQNGGGEKTRTVGTPLFDGLPLWAPLHVNRDSTSPS